MAYAVYLYPIETSLLSKNEITEKIGAEANYKLTRPLKPVQKNIEFINFI